ncbi:MAG: hypothetical protein ACXWAX_08655 [Chthoniobacterales bacterium]
MQRLDSRRAKKTPDQSLVRQLIIFWFFGAGMEVRLNFPSVYSLQN